MSRVCVFGSVAADIVLSVPAVPLPGRQVRATTCGWRPGGSSANVARALSSAGHDVVLVTALGGDDLGGALEQELEVWGVHVVRGATMPVSPRALLLVDETGERTIIDITGAEGLRCILTASPDLADVDAVFVENLSTLAQPLFDAVAGSGALVASSSLEQDPSRRHVVNLVVQSSADLPRSWLVSPYQSALEAGWDGLRCLVVTAGAGGALAYRAGHSGIRVPAAEAAQVDSTGAGDSFTAGVIHGLLVGATIEEAMRTGARWGARAVTAMQSVPPLWEESFGLLRAEA